MRFLATYALLIAAMPAIAAEPESIAPGNYFLSYGSTPRLITIAVVKVSTEKDKTTVETLDGASWKVSDLEVKGQTISMNVVIGSNNLTFEGILPAKEAKEILGSLGDDNRMFRATLQATDKEKIAPLPVPKLSKSQTELNAMSATMTRLQALLRTEKDEEKRKELQEEFATARKELQDKTPDLLKTIAMEETGTAAGYFASTQLMATAAFKTMPSEDVEKLAKSTAEFAALHGTRYEQDALAKLVTGLVNNQKAGPIAMTYAEKLVAMSEKSSSSAKLTALKALASVQKLTGKTDALTKTNASIEAMETVLDTEYKKTVPPFAPGKYAGRKDEKANKIAVMELFTGAECPPCVAADVAFDALEKAYSHKDLVLIQYHMHIPGPDPLTNASSEARWAYYREKFPMNVRGTPTSIFNGSIQAGGGGGMANSETKYKQYTEIINKTLEESSPISIEASATSDGDQIQVTVNTKAKEGELDDKVKVKLLLVEEEIRYVGGNQLRFHHQVVRSLFGKADGFSADKKVEAKVSLTKLREELTDYLDTYAKDVRPFRSADRPLDFKNLKVIVLLQNDETAEILNAIQVDLVGASE